MTWKSRLILLFALLPIALGCSRDGTRDKDPSHLLALVHIAEDSAQIIRAKGLDKAPHQELAGPMRLTKETWHRFEEGAEEVAAVFHHHDGSVLSTHGISAKAQVNFDFNNNGHIDGGPMVPRSDHRSLALPVPPDSGTLSFHRTQVKAGSGPDNTRITEANGRSLHSKPLRYVVLPKGTKGKVLAQGLSNHHEVNLQTLMAEYPQVDSLNWRISGTWKLTADLSKLSKPAGKLLSKNTLVDNGNPETQFNIVVMGDGFDSSEIDLYEDLVEMFSDYFFTQAPFDSLYSYINMYSITASSDESGIGHCSDTTHIETYYHLRGDFSTGTQYRYPGAIGSHHPQHIYDAAETVVPWEHTDLFFMIANCPQVEGGSGWSDLDVAFINYSTDTTYFKVTALHEIGHAVGKFSEEYVSGNPDQGFLYPNMARQAQVDSGTVRWKSMAFPSELNPDGSFKYTSLPKDGFDKKQGTNFPCYPNVENGTGYPDDGYRVGLIWGAQNVAAELANTKPDIVCGVMDLRGSGFYRASPWCRMRMQYWDFCRVCQQALVRRITNPQLGHQ